MITEIFKVGMGAVAAGAMHAPITSILKEEKRDIVLPNPNYRFQSGDSILVLGSPAGLKNVTPDETE